MNELRQITIAQNQNYLAFPDVALAPDGTLVCAYFEGDKHSPTWSNLIIKTSSDSGKTWSQPRSLVQSNMKKDGFCWNCPRISVLPDGRLFLICDWEDHSKERATWRWYSSDNGTTWSQPKRILSEGLCPDRVISLTSGRLLTTICCDERYIPEEITIPEQGGDRQILFYSDDGGEEWRPYSVIWAEEEMEGGLVALNDSDLICYFTNLKWKSNKAVSRDGGETWQRGPTAISATRPSPGVLASGKVLVTFGIRGGGTGTFASLETSGSALSVSLVRQKCAILKLADSGASSWWDYGYSGWVQLADGRIFCVYYTKPFPDYVPYSEPTQIDAVWFSESDFPPLT